MTDHEESPISDRPSTSEQSGQERQQSWYKQPSVLIAGLALAVSIGSTVATVLNNNSQAQSQDQQQLFTLAQDLNQVPSQRVTLQSTYANNAAELQNLEGQLLAAETIEVQEAAQLINALHDNVAPEVAYQVANSLFDVGLYSQAIKFYSIAISRGVGFPETISASYRGWGASLYDIGNPIQARKEMAQADSSYNRAGGSSSALTQNSIFTSLYQIPFEVTINNCRFAKAQFQDDLRLMAPLASSRPASYIQDKAEAAREESSVLNCT